MKLTTVWLGLAMILLLAMAVIAINARKRSRRATGELRARHPLTDREQSMYFRLAQTFPEHVVLAQVAFSALLDTHDRPTRSTFDRKVADFVLCSKGFSPIAVIELDDHSHRNKERADAKRDAILQRAGYRVVRFKQIPDGPELLSAFATPPAA